MELGRLRRQRADRAEIDDIALQFRSQRALEIGRDFHILAASDGAQFGNAGHFGRETYTPRAMNASIHRGLDQRANIFVFNRALVLGKAGCIDAVGHRLILQVAFAALVADRAVQAGG